MAKRVWRALPGGRPARWRKSQGDFRPGWCTTRFVHQVPPHWYRNWLNRKERQRARLALETGREAGWCFVHPRGAGWFW